MAKISQRLKFKRQKVLIRVDFNVPLKDGKITDENRIVQALPTINYVLENGGKAIIFSHLGRIKDEADKVKNSLAVVAERLSELLAKPVTFINETRGERLETAINAMKSGDVLMFENTRFEDLDGKESKNDRTANTGHHLRSLRKRCVWYSPQSTRFKRWYRIELRRSWCRILLEKEINFIGGTLENPERPFVAILGGAKVSDKIEVIKIY